MITSQAARAFGEKAVEAELLRHNWIPANVNQTVKNAARYDIYAVKDDRSVRIQVKTCRPGMPAFVCGSFKPDAPITTADVTATDFTVIVRMGDRRQNDRFYVVPTHEVRKEIGERQKERGERGVKDIGMWRMSFADRKDGRPEAGAGIERKWGHFEGAWDSLDGGS